MKKLHKILAVTALSSLVATGAMADTATDTVDAVAGIQPALELSCSEVKFGVWRVPVRSSGGTTTVTLAADSDTPSLSGNTTRVARSNQGTWLANRGTCTFSGSTAANEDLVAIGLSGNTNISMSAADATATGYTGLSAANTAAAMTVNLQSPNSTSVSNGDGTFHVYGTLTIPQIIEAANYGGYKTSSQTTVTINDGV